MKYNTLGDTNIKLSELGFGASAIGGMFNGVEKNEAIKTVHAAFDRGINYFDTSPAYGRNTSTYGPVTSETILGQALKDIKRSEIILSSKAGKISSLPPELNFSYQAILKSVEGSLNRLQTDYIDLLFLHDIEYNKGRHLETALDEGLSALRDLKKAGKIRAVGISCYSMDVLNKVIPNVDLDTVLVHNHYTLINDELLGLMPKIKAKGMGLVSASPFASGLLTHQGPPDWYPVDKKDLCVINKTLNFCLENNIPIEKLALQYALSNPEIPTTLFSCTERSILNKNIDWIEEPVAQDIIEDIRKYLEPIRNKDFDFGAYND
ncbi:aldo/keto reductase [Arenibacter sp. ARW7G5Y1]|uniref:aldo/keto reductase n=1 Tax=Arenibacter sp. ARW7G5Y1 TaxID=2135619 RepID=UPI000D769F01|nr:aldo/keto reductase [Arenibacter sp. ARW7G5Y1]PXX25394.1 aryl-alcohol dehydrogenase-like predicted oxidoreductase [Arenibacter sp. ARW7G5Y1]